MKSFLKFLAVILALLMVLAIVAVLYIDSIARKAVELGSSRALGVNTSLNTADVQILAGNFTMDGLTVANPAGFDASHFLTLNNGFVNLSFPSLRLDTIELPTLTLSGLDLNLQKKSGRANYQVILDNLKSLESDKTPPASTSRKYVIRTLLINNISAHVDTAGFSTLNAGTVDVKIDQVQLHDVGSGGKPLDLSHLTALITKAVFAAIIEKGAGLPLEMLNDLKSGLTSLASLQDVAKITGVGAAAAGDIAKLAGSLGKDAASAVGDVSKKAGDALGDVSDKASDAVGGILKDAGGLLGGKKDQPKNDPDKNKNSNP